jgi:HD-like signal output (HDOD) protein
METDLSGEKTIAEGLALEILSSRVRSLPVSATRIELLNMARQSADAVDTESFIRIVEKDPALSVRVLHLVNSPYYRGVERITTLRAAIHRIGLTEAVNSVCLFFLQNMLPAVSGIEGFSSRDYWAHSWACAVACRRLGHPALRVAPPPGELYMTGLLHGLGRLLLAIHFPDTLARCIRMARDFKLPLYRAEMDLIGTLDTLIAARIMETWNLPAPICAGVAYSQTPALAPAPFREIAGLTQFAYAIASLSGIGASGDGCPKDPAETLPGMEPGSAISRPGVREELTREILATLMERSEAMVGVPSPSSPGPLPPRTCPPGSDHAEPLSAASSPAPRPWFQRSIFTRIWSALFPN